MALFAIQLVRIVLTSLLDVTSAVPDGIIIAFDFVAYIHAMLNVIKRNLFISTFFCFADNLYLARASHQQ